jgi:ferredoxin
MDDFLSGFAEKYAKWRNEGDFASSSRVIPVQESLHAQQWVLPADQVFQVLESARSFALTDCVCRTYYRRCDSPRDVCFLINEASDRAVERGRARRITLAEASDVLKRADERGLVHLTLFMPDRKIYALCSCCACCCHDLQLLRDYHRADLVARSDYVAVTDPERCIHCGRCTDRCVFGARQLRDGILEYNPDACLGCGLCVSACPEKATVMRIR